MITIPADGSPAQGSFGTFFGPDSNDVGGTAAPLAEIGKVCESPDLTTDSSTTTFVIDDLFDVALPSSMLIDVASSTIGPKLSEMREDALDGESESGLSDDLLSLDSYFEEISKRRSGYRAR
jgi:hypothetical protein